MSIVIYKIESPSGKIYIGQSTNIEDRFKRYKGLRCKSQTKLYRSLLKYGVEKHSFTIIEECNVDLLNEREHYFQIKYNCCSVNGLNCRVTSYSDKTGFLSSQTKSAIKNTLTGRKRSTEECKNISNGLRGKKFSKERVMSMKGRTAWNKGLTCTDVHKKRVSDNNKMKRSVIDEKTGISYLSIKEAADDLKVNYAWLRVSLSRKSKQTTLKYL